MQSAYRSNHSTETALLRVHNDLLRALDERREIVIVLLHLSAAFDTIDHTIFINRLESYYGLSKSALSWFSLYLTDRTQKVVISDCESHCHTPTCGVPQGSVMGPLAFTFYIAPLSNIITAHNMKFNESKTEVIHFTSKYRTSHPLPPIKVGDTVVNTISKSRNLGVIFDSHLELKDHVSKVVQSAWVGVRKVGHLRKFLNPLSSEKLVHAFTTSHLDYCNSLLSGLPDKDISRLQRIQNASAWIIKGEVRSWSNLISEERVKFSEQNSENLMKIGWKIRKLWNVEVSQIFRKHFLTRSVWICKWVSWWCHRLTTCHIFCT